MTTGSAGKRAKQLKHIEYHGNRLAGTDNWNRAIHFLQQKLLHSVLCWLAVLMTGTTIWCTTSFFWVSKLLEHICGNVDSLLHIVMPHFHSCIIVIPKKTTSMVFRSGWTCFDVFSSRLVVGVIAFLCTEWIWLKIKVKKHFIAKQKKLAFLLSNQQKNFSCVGSYLVMRQGGEFNKNVSHTKCLHPLRFAWKYIQKRAFDFCLAGK